MSKYTHNTVKYKHFKCLNGKIKIINKKIAI